MNSHDPDFPKDMPAVPDVESMTPSDPPPTPAAEGWTDLDEAEPAAMVESPPRGPRSEAVSWPEGRTEPTGASARHGQERDEPDPSVLDAGSRSRREAEKPGRTVLPYDDWEPSEVPYQPKELGILDQLMIRLADGAAIWRRGLHQVRSWLPMTWQRTLNDELMTAIALGLLILWLVLWHPWGGRSTAGEIEERPKTSLSDPALSQGGGSVGNSLLLKEKGDSAPPIATNNRVKDNQTTEDRPEALEPSPEQNLIADIQDRVSKISRSYGVGLIQSVEVNWPRRRLSVNVSNAWYGLGIDSQDRIAQDIYTQAQGLSLATLQLRDADGLVVARNPVVGPDMVILKRHRPTEGDPLG